MNVITVTQDRALLGSYNITIKRSGASRPYTYTASGIDGAAAKAMELALGCVGKYQILGDTGILNAIRTAGIFGDNH